MTAAPVNYGCFLDALRTLQGRFLFYFFCKALEDTGPCSLDMLLTAIVASSLLLSITYVILYARKSLDDPRTLLITLGSGGHTGEMLSMLSTLDFSPFDRVVFYVSTGDSLSLAKAKDLSSRLDVLQVSIRVVPRARRVKQSFWTSPFTTFISLAAASYFIALDKPDLILSNGPGTGVVLIAVARFYRLLGLQHARIIFIESFARVSTLSLSGKLLLKLRLVDRFLTLWEQEKTKDSKVEYVGNLM